ncbi:MAG: hypothetical protein NC102_04630 [Clostridium sp.]|nr:hypothetical protein [Clostridium sp.]
MSYLSLSKDDISQLKADIIKALPQKYAGYKVKINVDKHSLEELASDANYKAVGHKEKTSFITDLSAPKAPAGLEGDNIAIWQSHGWYFEPKLNRWEWQRARVMQTVEDLYTQSYVMPFLMPMLENAGAYVMSPRERDIRLQEIVIDNDAKDSGYKEKEGSKGWEKAPKAGFAYDGSLLKNGSHPFSDGTARMAQTVGYDEKTSHAQYTASIPEDGDYAVYVSYVTLPNSSEDALYTVHAANGDRNFKVNQKMGGGTWIYLGHFPFKAGDNQDIVNLSNASAKKGAVVTADAVKVGGGIGNVARIVKEPLDDIDYQYVASGYPRFTEGARYWLQWAGAPDSVFTPSDYVNDYGDDYKSRGLWVNWLAGGSSMLPDREGLNIPVDLSFAFHSDAGTTLNDSIIGTLGIYFTQCNDGKYANGTSRMASRDLTNKVMSQIVDDVRAEFEPNWTRRGMWDKTYYEARVPEVPTMLLELLSHQNFADMKYGLDPAFRFVVSRAIYKGMLKFLAARDGKEYVVQPLPARSFAINGGGGGKYTLTWKATDDKLEPTAKPTYYIVEERKSGDVGFTPIATVNEPKYELVAEEGRVCSYRIVAGNDGGVSFPSEVLALCYRPGANQALVVNGFTRVSGPDTFDSGEIAGFYDVRDHGVPYVYDISFIGSQFEFRRDIPWMDDDAAGFGASRSNYETQPIAGNTFDYVAIHGQAIADCGYGFISASVEAFANGEVTNAPRVLDLIMGKQKEIKTGTGLYGNRFKTFPSDLQERIKQYTAAGGNVFLSGSFIATDLWDNPYSSKEVAEADKKFAEEVLGYAWRVGQASITGEAYEVDSRFRAFNGGEFSFYNELNPDFYAVESPDSFYAKDSKKGATIMRYSENNLVAGIAYDPGAYRTVVLGFPFETIKDASHRTKLMGQILNFFSQK